MSRIFQRGDHVRVVNGKAVNFSKEGIVIEVTPMSQFVNPNCTVQFEDGLVHTYMAVELHRLNQEADETSQ
jgi:DNA-directed RNA polymerase subunit E'/Rpb7